MERRILAVAVFGILTFLASNRSFATPLPPSTCNLQFLPNSEAACSSRLSVPSQGSTAVQCPDGEMPRRHQQLVPDTSSTCPWYYTTDYQSDRIPASIEVANCMCDNHCLNPNNSRINDLLTCQEVKYTMKVLIRSSDDDEEGEAPQYRLQDYTLPVACACMRVPR